MGNRECTYYLQTQNRFNHHRSLDRKYWGKAEGLCSYVIENPDFIDLNDGACLLLDQAEFSDYGKEGYDYQGEKPPKQVDETQLKTIRCPLVSLEDALRNRR